jgi:hypothetical protein
MKRDARLGLEATECKSKERKPWSTPHVITSDLDGCTEKITAVTDNYSQGPVS